MKNIFFILFLLYTFFNSSAQSITVEFDNLPLKLVGTPYSPVYEYSYGQTIYLENDIQGSGAITALTFFYNGSTLNSRDVTVFLGTTFLDHLDSIYGFKTVDMHKVFQGTIPSFSIPGPVTITLDSAYNYNDSNLIIAINETTAGKDTLIPDQFLGYYPGARNRGLTWGNFLPWNLPAFDFTPGQFPTAGGGVPKITIHGLTRFPCQSPRYVRFDKIVHNAARINWTPPDSGNTPTGYDIYYSTSRYKPSSAITTPYTTVDSFYALAGLASATWYYAWVRTRSASCTSVWTVVDSFKTTCSPTPTPTPAEPFGKIFPPTCWELAMGTLANPTKFIYMGPAPYHYWRGAPYRDVAGSDSAAKGFFRTDTLRHWLISPPYDLGSAGNKSLEFDAALTKNGSTQQGNFDADDMFAVVISTDEGITWSIANTLRSWALPQVISSAGVHYTLPLSAYSGLVRIGFYIQSTSGNPVGSNIPTLFIDNVKVSEILPVKLLEFTGVRLTPSPSPRGEGVSANLLRWRTATEQNNRGFELQRAAQAPSNSPGGGGQNPAMFSTIAFVPTKANGGNSTAELSYTFTDNSPLTTHNCYYRLKQVDFDAKFTYSNVVFIKGEQVTELTLTSLFPNPTNQLLNAVLEAPAAQRVQLIISDLAGKVVKQQTLNLQKGTNNKVVNVAALAKGSYVVKVICKDDCERAVKKFVRE